MDEGEGEALESAHVDDPGHTPLSVIPLDVIRDESPAILAADRDTLVLRNGKIGVGRIRNSTARVKEECGTTPYCLYPYGFSSGVRPLVEPRLNYYQLKMRLRNRGR